MINFRIAQNPSCGKCYLLYLFQKMTHLIELYHIFGQNNYCILIFRYSCFFTGLLQWDNPSSPAPPPRLPVHGGRFSLCLFLSFLHESTLFTHFILNSCRQAHRNDSLFVIYFSFPLPLRKECIAGMDPASAIAFPAQLWYDIENFGKRVKG